MASLALGLAGGYAGAALFGPGAVAFGLTGAQIGFYAGSFLGDALFGGSQNIQQEGQRLSDLRVQAAQYGTMIPIYYGVERGAGTVIWSTELIEKATTTEQDSGGKGIGGGGSVETTNYTYSVSFAVSVADTFGRKPRGIRRVWANAELIIDLRPEAERSKNFDGNYRIYLGGEEQEPSSLQESILGVGNVPAYRGQMVVEFENMQLAKFGNRIPNLSFEVVMEDDNALPAPVVTETGLNIIFAPNSPDKTRMFAWRYISPSRVDVGYFNYTNKTFSKIREYDSTVSPGDEFVEFLFTFSHSGVHVESFKYLNPLSASIETKLCNLIYKNQPGIAYYKFDYNSGDFLEKKTTSEIGFPTLLGNTNGMIYWNEYAGRFYVLKQNFVLNNSVLTVFHPDLPILNPLTGSVEFTGTQQLSTYTGVDFVGNFGYPQPYFFKDIFVVFNATTAGGTNTCFARVAKLDQDGVYSPLFDCNVKSTATNGVSCFYDENRARLVFLSIDSSNDRLLATSYYLQRYEELVALPENIAKTFDSTIEFDSTPIENYVTDENGAFITGQDLVPNLAGITNDNADAYFVLFQPKTTININADSFQIVSQSEITGGAIVRTGSFAPVFTDNYWNITPNKIMVYAAASIGQAIITEIQKFPDIGSAARLSSIVDDLTEKVGLSGDVDTTELQNDFVDGYKVAQVMPARQAIETLQRAYSFDQVESTE